MSVIEMSKQRAVDRAKAVELDRQEAVAADRARIDGLATAMRAELVPAVVAERDAQWQQSLAPQDPQVARVAALQEALRANVVSQPQVQAQSAFANQPIV
jgi:hypothetical protein